MTLSRDHVLEIDLLALRMYRAGISYEEGVREYKRSFILIMLEECGWNQCKAARLLGMHRNTLNRTVQELGLKRSVRVERARERNPSPAPPITRKPVLPATVPSFIGVERAR